MKTLFALLLLLPLSAFAQSKTWGGNSTTIRPNQGTNTIALSTGVVTVAINYTNTVDDTVRLIDFQEDGGEIGYVSGWGGLVKGSNVDNLWGAPTSSDYLLSFVSTTDDALTSSDVTIGIANDEDWDTYAYSQIIHDASGPARFTGEGFDSVNKASWFLGWTVVNSPLLRLSVGTGSLTSRTLLDPSGSAGSGQPYLLDTSVPITSDQILSVKNNGTNYFNVTFDGKIKTRPAVTTAGEWRLGTIITNSAVTVITDSYVEISINGQVLKLAIVQ